MLDSLFTGFIGGLVSGPLAWFATSFVGEPLKKVWDLRRETILALNRHSRYVAGSTGHEIDDAALFDYAIKSTQEGREAAEKEFKDLGHRLFSMHTSDPFLPRKLLAVVGINTRVAGILLLDLARSLDDPSHAGPARGEICHHLRIRE